MFRFAVLSHAGSPHSGTNFSYTSVVILSLRGVALHCIQPHTYLPVQDSPLSLLRFTLHHLLTLHTDTRVEQPCHVASKRKLASNHAVVVLCALLLGSVPSNCSPCVASAENALHYGTHTSAPSVLVCCAALVNDPKCQQAEVSATFFTVLATIAA